MDAVQEQRVFVFMKVLYLDPRGSAQFSRGNLTRSGSILHRRPTSVILPVSRESQ